jgi:hypothetical protein
MGSYLLQVYVRAIVQAHFNHFQVTALDCQVERAGFLVIHKVNVRLSTVATFFTFGRK